MYTNFLILIDRIFKFINCMFFHVSTSLRIFIKINLLEISVRVRAQNTLKCSPLFQVYKGMNIQSS
jgi:hypothetical protein